MYEIREASMVDVEQIYAVSAFLGYAPGSIEQTRVRLQEIIYSGSDHVWVYEEGEEIKGWLHLFVSLNLASAKFAEIVGVVVEHSSQGSGIGGKLIERAIQWSKSNELVLRVRCNQNREAANRFYEDIGFERCKTQNVYQLCS